jgi:hypothetical protein
MQQRGFTLIQLATALCVTTLIATAVSVDFIGKQRVRLAERAVRDVQAILDGARWFYNGVSNDPYQRRWPGATPACAASGADPYLELTSSRYIANVPPTDPWGRNYTLSVTSVGGICMFEVRTNGAPTSAHNLILNSLPHGNLPNECTGGVCITRLPPPGMEAAFGGTYTLPPPPPKGECTAGQVENRACTGAKNESCGNQKRTCGADLKWGAWSACPKCPCPYKTMCGVAVDGADVCGKWVQATGCGYGGYDRVRTCDSRYDCRVWDHNGACTPVNICEPVICYQPNVDCRNYAPF